MTREAYLASREGGVLGFYDPAELARNKATNYGYVHAERLEGNVVSTQTKADILKIIARPLDPNRPSPRFSTEDVSVRVFGDTAVLSGKVKMTMGERTHVDRYTDTWMWRGGRWVVVASQLAAVP